MKEAKVNIIKDIAVTIQAIITIVAIIIGGIWTYSKFVKEREHFPHANVKHKVTHISLSDKINLLRVAVVVSNSGNNKITLGELAIRIQQILPILSCSQDDPCAKNQINRALRETKRQEDRFSWPLVAERISTWPGGIDIEPGESDELDFEFAIPSEITHARIYSYLYNEKKEDINKKMGWGLSTFYNFAFGG